MPWRLPHPTYRVTWGGYVYPLLGVTPSVCYNKRPLCGEPNRFAMHDLRARCEEGAELLRPACGEGCACCNPLLRMCPSKCTAI